MADSFRDDFRHPDFKGPNPFADDVTDDVGETSNENIYVASGDSGYQSEEYAISISDRGWTIITMAISGIVAMLIGWLTVMNMMCLPMPLFALGLTIPAWLMARSDLAAMRAGAMSSGRRSLVSTGLILAFVGTVMSLGILVVGLWRIAVSVG